MVCILCDSACREAGKFPPNAVEGARELPCSEGARELPCSEGARELPCSEGERELPYSEGARVFPSNSLGKEGELPSNEVE